MTEGQVDRAGAAGAAPDIAPLLEPLRIGRVGLFPAGPRFPPRWSGRCARRPGPTGVSPASGLTARVRRRTLSQCCGCLSSARPARVTASGSGPGAEMTYLARVNSWEGSGAITI